MNIQGFQKLTLLDFPGHVAATLFTGGCNFRCPFCHNAVLVEDVPTEPEYTEDEILGFLSKRKGLLDGICITGGEPLLQKDIAGFMRKVKALGFLIKLDTNGSFPDRLKELLDEGLPDYVAMDIKNSPAKYSETSGVPVKLDRIEESIRLLRGSGIPFEFRTTVVAGFHTVDDFAEIGKFIEGAPRYFIQSFKDSGDILRDGLSPVSFDELQKMKAAVEPFVKEVSLRGV